MPKLYFTTLLLISIFFNFYAQAQELEWAKSTGSVGVDRAFKITTDNSGNIISSGIFNNTIDFDPNSGVDQHSSNGSSDIFVQKLDSNGNFIWAVTFGGDSFEYNYGVTTDTNENIYVTGAFQQTVDFGNGSDIITSQGELDVFIIKLNSNGDLLWVKTLGGSGTEISEEVKIDGAGNIYITGAYEGTVDFDPGAGIQEFTSLGRSDIFILKLDVDGNYIWAKCFGGILDDYANALTIDSSENIVTTGYFSQNVDFDPSSEEFIISSNNTDVFIQKLDPAGNFIWAKGNSSSAISQGKSIITDNTGNIYIAGAFDDSLYFGSENGNPTAVSNGSTDSFILKLNELGDFRWLKSIGGSEGDFTNDITLDSNNNVIATGVFTGAVDFDPGSNSHIINSNGSQDMFIQILDATGSFINAHGTGASSFDYGEAITVDNEDNIYLATSFSETVDIDPSSDTYPLTSNGLIDFSIAKFSPISLGINENSFQTYLITYPNPTSGNLTIAFGEYYENINISIYNSLGQHILKKTEYQTNKLELNIDAPAGVYFGEIETDQKSIIKIIKE